MRRVKGAIMSSSSARSLCRVLAVVVAAAMPAALLSASPTRAAEPPEEHPAVRDLDVDDATRGDWRIRESPGGVTLTWEAERRLPTTSSRPEFRIGDRVIGYPTVVNGRTLRLDGFSVADASDVQVRSEERRVGKEGRARGRRRRPKKKYTRKQGDG